MEKSKKKVYKHFKLFGYSVMNALKEYHDCKGNIALIHYRIDHLDYALKKYKIFLIYKKMVKVFF